MNSCVNPLIYSNLHTSFRRSSLRLLCSCMFERFKAYHWDQMGDSIRTIVRRSSRSVRGSLQSSRRLLSTRRKSAESISTMSTGQDTAASVGMHNGNNGSLTSNRNSYDNKNGSLNSNRNSYNNDSTNGRMSSSGNYSAGSLASSMSSSRKLLRCQLLSKRKESSNIDMDNNNSSSSSNSNKENKQRHSTTTSILSTSPNSNSSSVMQQGFELVPNNNNNDTNNYRGKIFFSAESSGDSPSMSVASHLLVTHNINFDNDVIANDDVFEHDAMPLTTRTSTLAANSFQQQITPDQELSPPKPSKDGGRNREHGCNKKSEQRRSVLQSMREQSTIEEIL